MFRITFTSNNVDLYVDLTHFAPFACLHDDAPWTPTHSFGLPRVVGGFFFATLAEKVLYSPFRHSLPAAQLGDDRHVAKRVRRTSALQVGASLFVLAPLHTSATRDRTFFATWPFFIVRFHFMSYTQIVKGVAQKMTRNEDQHGRAGKWHGTRLRAGFVPFDFSHRRFECAKAAPLHALPLLLSNLHILSHLSLTEKIMASRYKRQRAL